MLVVRCITLKNEQKEETHIIIGRNNIKLNNLYIVFNCLVQKVPITL